MSNDEIIEICDRLNIALTAYEVGTENDTDSGYDYGNDLYSEVAVIAEYMTNLIRKYGIKGSDNNV